MGSGMRADGTIVRVRRVQPDEAAAVGELAVRAYDPSGLTPNDPYFADLRDVAARDAAAEVWVAVRDEGDGLARGVLGTVTWCPTGSPWGEIARPGEAEFRMLAVDPGAQRLGVGTALVSACVARARAQGADGVVLSTAEWMVAAHRLYAELGFRRDPSRDWSPRPDIRLLAYGLPL
jgi:ribosomal protein S18 acetylase RimI-like enzyme